MNHNLLISVSKTQKNEGVLACRTVSIRERLLRLFLGTPQKLTILVPGDSIEEVAITEVREGGVKSETL